MIRKNNQHLEFLRLDRFLLIYFTFNKIKCYQYSLFIKENDFMIDEISERLKIMQLYNKCNQKYNHWRKIQIKGILLKSKIMRDCVNKIIKMI